MTASSQPVLRGRGASAPARRPSVSVEDYLERIGELEERTGGTRMVDIARALRVSRPSVTAMVKRLAAAGYVDYTRYQGLGLTPRGRKLARQVRDRHTMLKRFLAMLGVDEAIQETDIEGWEHCLSTETLGRVEQLTRFLEARPALLRELRQMLDTPS